MLTIRKYRLPAESAPCRWSFSALATPTTCGRSKETLSGRGLGCGTSEEPKPPRLFTMGGISLDALLFAIAPKLKLVELAF